MDLINSFLEFARSLDPLILIVGGLALLFVLFMLLRAATGLIMRVLTLGCGVIVLAIIAWAIVNFVF